MLSCRSSEDLTSGDELERHCVAGLGREGLLTASGGSTSSLSDGGGGENGDVREGGRGTTHLEPQHTKSKTEGFLHVCVCVIVYT